MKSIFPLLRRIGLSGLVLATTAIGFGVAAEDNVDHMALDKAARASEPYVVKGAERLNFHAVKLNNFVWSGENRTLSEWDEYGMFDKVSLRSTGYDPADPDHFQIQLISTEIKPETIARGVDYARLFAKEWSPSIEAIRERGRDAGDVTAVGADPGSNRRERVAAWRWDKLLLVARASYSADQADFVEPRIAQFFGTLKFDRPAQDSIEQSLRWEKLPPSSGTIYSAHVPEGWMKLRQSSAPSPSYTAALFTNSKDPNGNSAVGLFVFPTGRKGLAPTDEELRQFAAKIIDIELENLMPKVGYKLDQDVAFIPEEKLGDSERGYIDAVTLQGSGQRIRAKTVVSVKGDMIVAVASISAYPDGPAEVATMIHTDFVTRVLSDGLTKQLN